MPLNASGTWTPIVTYTDATTVASGGTRAAPTLATDGMDISDATGWRVIVSADSGQTLSGAGTVQIWLWSIALGRWVRNKQLDYSVAETGVRDAGSPDFAAYAGFGRVFPQVAGVTSSGGNITTSAEAGRLQ